MNDPAAEPAPLRGRVKRRAVVASLAALAATRFLRTACAAQSVTISVPSTNVDDEAYYVAVEKGYFAAEGLDVDITVAGGGVATPGLLSGSIQGSASSASALSAILRGADLRILLVFASSPDYQLWGNPEIRSLADLQGKSVGIQTRGDTFEISTRIALAAAGIPADAVGFTPLGVGAVVGAALSSGAVPAICTAGVEVHEIQAQGQMKNAHLVLGYYGKVHMPLNGYVVAQKLITEQPQVARGMVRGIVKAMRYMRAYRDQTLQIAGKLQKSPSLSALAEDYDQLIRGASPSLTVGDDVILADLAIRAQLLKIAKDQIPPVNKVYDFSLVRSVNAELDASRWKPTA